MLNPKYDSFSPFDLSVFDRASHVAVMQAFFDASEGGGYLTVGGYLFRKKHIKPFTKRWRAMLRKFGIEYFRMTECNTASGEFSNKGEQECDQCARTAIPIITDYATSGITATVDIGAFEQSGLTDFMQSPFSLAAYSALVGCRQWAEANDLVARVFYVFEAGDDYQSDANQLLNSISEDAERRQTYYYEDHAFLTKRGSLPTQAADILAWHARKQWGREDRGIEHLRGDFSELVDKVETKKFIWDEQYLREMHEESAAATGSEDWAKVVGKQLRRTASNARRIDREVAAILERVR
ncbi:DUF3800 domain-containing protein [Parasphingopyxis algicola]|uniref:hypothetical protein n=1 Tax=Parasphingopyxis algicola TaxID=2026624 RepID=UPI00159F9D2E|nr:hypothetical protein [Parasphingopyxis algicola]QLC25097.1 DUF3800 domain-containing protein [Parasphingopyxis algicola]